MTLSFLIISRYFFLAFCDVFTCVIFAKVVELKLDNAWMIGYWS